MVWISELNKIIFRVFVLRKASQGRSFTAVSCRVCIFPYRKLLTFASSYKDWVISLGHVI
jgi:hypothetical protein